MNLYVKRGEWKRAYRATLGPMGVSDRRLTRDSARQNNGKKKETA